MARLSLWAWCWAAGVDAARLGTPFASQRMTHLTGEGAAGDGVFHECVLLLPGARTSHGVCFKGLVTCCGTAAVLFVIVLF